jgi:hypothetical protein
MIALRVPSYALKLELIPYLTRNPQLEPFSFFQYSSIPPFQSHTLSLDSEALEGRLSTGWGQAPILSSTSYNNTDFSKKKSFLVKSGSGKNKR